MGRSADLPLRRCSLGSARVCSRRFSHRQAVVCFLRVARGRPCAAESGLDASHGRSTAGRKSSRGEQRVPPLGALHLVLLQRLRSPGLSGDVEGLVTLPTRATCASRVVTPAALSDPLFEKARCVAGGDTLRRWTRGVPRNTDDHPIIEFQSGLSHFGLFGSEELQCLLIELEDLASSSP